MKEKNKKIEYLNFSHARNPKQILIMEKIKKDNICPFCEKNFLKYHTNPILKSGKWWLVTKNFAPYSGTKIHLLFIYRKKHIEKIEKINPIAGVELLKLISWYSKKFKIKGGSFFARFGDTFRTGSSVNHLHVQLIAGNSKLNAKNSIPLKVKLGYKKEKNS